MHWSTCCSKACVSTPDGRGHSCPPSAVEKVYREFAVDHGTCHAFLYACIQIADPPTHSATIRGGLPRTASCRFLSVRRVPQKVLASAGVFWLDHVPLSPFHGLPLLWRSCHPFPCPSNLGTGTCHWCLAFRDFHHLSPDLVPACFPFASDPC